MNRNPNSPVLMPRDAAAAVLRDANLDLQARQRRIRSGYEGQEAGVPGQGTAPDVVHMPGAAVMQKLLHPAFNVFEQLDRALPDESWFDPDLTPRRPVQFQLGAYTVPSNMTLWLFDYQFQVYRPSGVDPGDFVPASAGRFSNQMGFDITVNGRRENNLSYQLTPQNVTFARQEFGSSGPQGAANFFQSTAGSFASTSSQGKSLLPARPNMQGPRGMPFTMVVGDGGTVAMNTVIFNTIRAPISTIEGRLAGYLIHTNLSESLLNRVRPR